MTSISVRARQPMMGVVLVTCLGLSACTSVPTYPGQSDAIIHTESMPGIERIRLSQIVAWQLMSNGDLWVELNNPRRAYRLILRPSCTFALRQATEFELAGKSSNYIALGDEVVVGQHRCQIVGIFLSEDQQTIDASAVKRWD